MRRGGVRTLHSTSPSHSRDSAIDSDVAEFETDTLEVKVQMDDTLYSSTGTLNKEEMLGVELIGGRDDTVPNGWIPLHVKSVTPHGRFDGYLKYVGDLDFHSTISSRAYDCIESVNDIDVTNMERRAIIDLLLNCKHVKMIIKRRRLVGMKVFSGALCLNCYDKRHILVPLSPVSNAASLGLDIESGVYISKIEPGCAAAQNSQLAVGDRIIYVRRALNDF